MSPSGPGTDVTRLADCFLANTEAGAPGPHDPTLGAVI